MTVQARERNDNLDLLRAIAISMVLVFHVTQMSPIASEWLRRAVNYGQYGVDLFFVLSGWLIGGLYWRERARFGDVKIGRFWLRRWARTIPPYLAALALSYAAVLVSRGERFDVAYLLFLQNYHQRIPYFLVSWSLCIEEHFYLFLPIALLFVARSVSVRTVSCLFMVTLLISPVMRYFWYPHWSPEFGYSWTATHMRLEPLVIGVWLAYVSVEGPGLFKRLQRFAPYVLALSALALPLIMFAGRRIDYTLRWTDIAVLFSAALVWAASTIKLEPRTATTIRVIALPSYSIYLTHPLALHVAVALSEHRPFATILYFVLALLLITASAAVFYFGVEKASISIRDAYIPRRQGVAAVPSGAMVKQA